MTKDEDFAVISGDDNLTLQVAADALVHLFADLEQNPPLASRQPFGKGVLDGLLVVQHEEDQDRREYQVEQVEHHAGGCRIDAGAQVGGLLVHGFGRLVDGPAPFLGSVERLELPLQLKPQRLRLGQVERDVRYQGLPAHDQQRDEIGEEEDGEEGHDHVDHADAVQPRQLSALQQHHERIQQIGDDEGKQEAGGGVAQGVSGDEERGRHQQGQQGLVGGSL